MAGRRLRLPGRRAADGALRGRRRRSTARAAGGASGSPSGRRAIYCLAGAAASSRSAILEAAFLRSDFSFALVAESSSTDTPTFYKVTAHVVDPGRLAAAVGHAAVALLERGAVPHAPLAARASRPYATAVLGGIAAFFLLLMVGWENPFDTLAVPPAEGAGLNPLLRHPAMMIHPPMLYTGYVGFSIPFAFAIGALVTRRTGRRLDPRHAPLRADRLDLPRHRDPARRALVVLRARLGRLLGLGPGRERVADAVARRHRVPPLDHGPGEARDAEDLERVADLRRRSCSRCSARSSCAAGILDSIHAFGASTIGVQFLIFIGSWSSLLGRADRLRGSATCAREARLDSLLSREAFFLLNNLVLVGLCLVIFWGTFFPLISEALTGDEASVGPPWFDRYRRRWRSCSCCCPGIGPVLAWRRVTPGGAAARAARAARRSRPSCSSRCSRFTDAADSRPSLVDVLPRGLRARGRGPGVLARRRGAARDDRRAAGRARWRGSIGRNRRRYGGYLVHAGHRRAVPRRGGVVGVPRPARRAPVARRVVRGRRLQGHLPRGHRAARRRLRPAPGAPISFGAVLDVRKDGKRFTLRPVAQLLLRRRPVARHDLALLRGRGHQRGRRALGPAPRLLARRAARPRARSSSRSARPTESSPTRRATSRR